MATAHGLGSDERVVFARDPAEVLSDGVGETALDGSGFDGGGFSHESKVMDF